MPVNETFDNYAELYDRSRRRLIPCFDDFYGTAIDVIPFDRQKEISVLDLGAGTGLLSAMVAERYPCARLTLMDVAAKMLEQARGRLAGVKDRVVYVTADYAEENAVANRYDIIISALSIHHLGHDAKRDLFRNLYGRLNPGGIFINADQVLGAEPEIDEVYRRTWIEQVKQRGTTEKELTAAFERMQEDRMSTLPYQLNCLREAGFSQVNCWYKNYSFVVYSGRRR